MSGTSSMWLLVSTIAACRTPEPTTYYVDARAGQDLNTGTSPDAAWRTLGKVNATTFQPGDTIRFKAGDVWPATDDAGRVLAPAGAGVADDPIRIDSYGDGDRPRIDAGGVVGGAMVLHNQSYWEIRNLEVTNCTPQPGGGPCLAMTDPDVIRLQSIGIQVLNDEPGVTAHHIVIADNDVHDVAGLIANPAHMYGKNAGISVNAHMDVGSSYDDVTIDHNVVRDVDRIGIFVGAWDDDGVGDIGDETFSRRPRSSNIRITRNIVDASGGDGILNYVTNDTLVEHNVVANGGARGTSSAGIWCAASTNTTIQYNEVYGEQYGDGGWDKMAFDADWGSVGTYIQYNYSHDNFGGFVMTYETNGEPAHENTYVDDVIVRWNVSYNDGSDTAVFTLCGSGPRWPTGPNPIDIANNVIYLGPAETSDLIAYCGERATASGPTITGAANLYNNIFFTLGTTAYPLFEATNFDSNVYFTPRDPIRPLHEPADVHRIIEDPRFIDSANPVDGLRLSAGSPALFSGTPSFDLGGLDYWGNAVSSPPNRGAYGGNGL